jgi:DNA-binding NtrC family response regulator
VDAAGAEAVRPRPRTGTETILLAEDEEEVRNLAREILRMEGYTIIEARHGNDALSVAAQHDGPIHMLMTDVVMPQMGGRELVRRLTAVRPGLKVLYVSGYTDENVLPSGSAGALPAFLQKPFTADGLLRKIRDVLDAAAPAPAGAGGR